jgi:hypothetical protein
LDYIASSGGIWKEALVAFLMLYVDILVEGQRKNTKILSQVNLTWSPDLNAVLVEREEE